MYTQILSKNELVINAEEEKEKKRKKKGEEGRKRKQTKTKQKTNGHVKHREKKGKTGDTTTELPTNTPALSKINENNREKSKSRKVNRNSAGLCTLEINEHLA